MQIRLLVFSFVATVVIKLGIRKHKENIPQKYIQIQGHPPVVPQGYINTFPLFINFIFNLCIRVCFHSYLIIAKLESLHIENYILLTSGTIHWLSRNRDSNDRHTYLHQQIDKKLFPCP